MARKPPSSVRKAPAKAGPAARAPAKPAAPRAAAAKAEKAPKAAPKAPEPPVKPVTKPGGLLAAKIAAKKGAADAAAKAGLPGAVPTKLAKKAAPKGPKKPATPRPAPRLKIVWAVCDHTLKTIKTFPYPERRAAELEAGRLQKSKGKEHLVRAERVPMTVPPEAKPVAKRASP